MLRTIPRIKSSAVALTLIGLNMAALLATIYAPLPWDLDKLRIHAAWFPAPRVLESANVFLSIIAIVCIAFVLIPFLGGQNILNREIPHIENAATRRVVAAIGWFGIALLLVAFVGYPGVQCRRLAKTWMLQRIETAITSEAAFRQDSETTFPSITERYKAANVIFVSSLTNDSASRLTLVTAPGGFGKSFLMNHLREALGNRIKLYKLTSFGGQWKTPDLVIRQGEGRITLNYLLELPETASRNSSTGFEVISNRPRRGHHH